MLVAYVRVSTADQNRDMQFDAINKAGASRVFTEKRSGVKRRPELALALDSLQAGDIFIVWKIDRCARSLRELLKILDRVKSAGASFRSLTEPIDTSTPIGEFTFQILGAVAQLERSIIRERVVAGQAAARSRGKTWGRTAKLSPVEAAHVADMWRSGWYEQGTLADMFGMSESALRDSIHRHEGRGRWAGRVPGVFS